MTPNETRCLNEIIAIELRTQLAIAQARARATSIINAAFQPGNGKTGPSPTLTRLAMQFVARPFQPLTAALRTFVKSNSTPAHNGKPALKNANGATAQVATAPVATTHVATATTDADQYANRRDRRASKARARKQQVVPSLGTTSA